MGALSAKTVLLVTHQVDFLPAFDSVLVSEFIFKISFMSVFFVQGSKLVIAIHACFLFHSLIYYYVGNMIILNHISSQYLMHTQYQDALFGWQKILIQFR